MHNLNLEGYVGKTTAAALRLGLGLPAPDVPFVPGNSQGRRRRTLGLRCQVFCGNSLVSCGDGAADSGFHNIQRTAEPDQFGTRGGVEANEMVPGVESGGEQLLVVRQVDLGRIHIHRRASEP